MAHLALMTDHPGWIHGPDGSRARLLNTGTGLWLAAATPRDLVVTNLSGSDDLKPVVLTTVADELPPDLPPLLSGPLADLGTVQRVSTPWLWEAISTAILRQVVRATQARKIHRAWCIRYGTVRDTAHGRLATVPGPETVLGLADGDFKDVGAAFHRTALQAAARAYLTHADRWADLRPGALAAELTSVPRIGPWTAAAAAADFHGDFAVYPHHDLAVRTWAARIAPAHPWPRTEREFGAAWRRMADSDDRQLHALTAYTLTWGTIHAERPPWRMSR